PGGFSDHPASGLRCHYHGPRVRGSERVVLSRSSSLLRPDPPVALTPAAFPGALVIPQLFARRPALGCRRALPGFGSLLLPYVPSPLRREEDRGTPVIPRFPRGRIAPRDAARAQVPRRSLKKLAKYRRLR